MSSAWKSSGNRKWKKERHHHSRRDCSSSGSESSSSSESRSRHHRRRGCGYCGGGGCGQCTQQVQCQVPCRAPKSRTQICTRCGVLSISLLKTANVISYTTVGQVVTYSYTVTNTGTSPLCAPLYIEDNQLGWQAQGVVNIAPGLAQTFTRPYTITAANLQQRTITNTATAYVQVETDRHHRRCRKWLRSNSAALTINNGTVALNVVLSQVFNSTSNQVVLTLIINNPSTSTSSATGVALVSPIIVPPLVGALTSPTPGITIAGGTVSFAPLTLAIGATESVVLLYTPTGPPTTMYLWAATVTATNAIAPVSVTSSITPL